ncbi:MarR family transcriptional regulator [Lachnospiraceae bacterium ZAX-1]
MNETVNTEELPLHAKLMLAFHRVHKVKLSSMMELSQGEFFTLQIIAKHMIEHPNEKGIYVSKLAKQLHIASSAVSRMLKNLEEKGMIDRAVDRTDRRNTNVFLTENGQKHCEKVMLVFEEYMSRVIEQMGENEVRQMISLCNKMTDIMAEELHKMIAGSGGKHSGNTDKWSDYTDKHSDCTGKHSHGIDKHRDGTDKHSHSTNKHSDGTENHSGTDKHSHGTENHSGTDRKDLEHE